MSSSRGTSSLFVVFFTLTVACVAMAAEPKVEEKEVALENGPVSLSGTLFVPPGKGPFPAVVLLHGSGPMTRDGHRPLAQKLAAAGYAALTYDKRGTGKSTGSWVTSSIRDLAADGVAAVRFLASHPDIDSGRLGIYAVSQSGWYAPMIAATDSAVSFVVVASGGGATPREVEWHGYERALDEAQAHGHERQRALDIVRRYFRYLEDGSGRDELLAAVDGAKDASWLPAVNVRRVLPSLEIRPQWSWVSTYEPAADIERLRVPTLVVFGGQDPFVPVNRAVDAWTRSLARSAAPHTVRVFSEAGHGLTLGAHGHGAEPRFAPGYVEMVLAFLDHATERKP